MHTQVPPNTRRTVLLASAAAVAAPMLWLPSAPALAQAGPYDGIHHLKGLVRVNGETITSKRVVIKAGDTLSTGTDGQLWVAIGQDAFLMRERTQLELKPAGTDGAAKLAIGAMRLVTGAIGAVFGKRTGAQMMIQTPTATVGIRGTGTYLESRGDGMYCCTCFGDIDFVNPKSGATVNVKATQHAPKFCAIDPKGGPWIVDAPLEHHTDDEMDALQKCVGRRAPWAQGSA
jgi:hypothetical protein